MASPSQHHLTQWQHNRKLIAKLPPSHRDWIVTAVFYTALHIVTAVIEADGLHAMTHVKRFKLLNGSDRYLKLRAPYRSLYQASIVVRYETNWERLFPSRQIHDQFIRRGLVPIERSCCELLQREEPDATELLIA